jgi:excinuclease ABC subunit B
MYADTVTRSMKNAIDETNRRRKVQTEYNKTHGIVPKTIVKEVHDVIDLGKKTEEAKKTKKMSAQEKAKLIEQLTSQMREASRKLEFEKAAYLRDRIRELQITKQEKGKND